MSDNSPFKHKKADDSAGFLLWKLTNLWQRRLSRDLGTLGITQTQFAILASLRWFETQGEPTTQTHLVEHAKIDKMTVSKAIRKLEEDALVSREPSQNDNRATEVHFTATGRRLIQKAVVAVERADEEFFSGLEAVQLQTFKELMAHIIRSNND